jgi:hypothetical protein
MAVVQDRMVLAVGLVDLVERLVAAGDLARLNVDRSSPRGSLGLAT